jgi:hypothetical protein
VRAEAKAKARCCCGGLSAAAKAEGKDKAQAGVLLLRLLLARRQSAAGRSAAGRSQAGPFASGAWRALARLVFGEKMSGAALAQERFAGDARAFLNKAPRSRAERHAGRDKEAKERALLEKRPAVRGQKYINYGGGIASAEQGTVAHITEQDRFFTDFAAEEKKRREQQLSVKSDQINRRRFELAHAEEQRWTEIDARFAAEEAKLTSRQHKGVPRNKNSVPYNPLTLQYEESADGEVLKYTDEQIRYRAALRAERLHAHNTRAGFNPITGEESHRPQMPPQPQPPAHYVAPASSSHHNHH